MHKKLSVVIDEKPDVRAPDLRAAQPADLVAVGAERAEGPKGKRLSARSVNRPSRRSWRHCGDAARG